MRQLWYWFYTTWAAIGAMLFIDPKYGTSLFSMGMALWYLNND